MQQPINYASDCIRLVGYVIDHTPWPSVDHNQRKDSCEDTIKTWKDEFKTDMSIDHLYNTTGNGYDSWDE